MRAKKIFTFFLITVILFCPISRAAAAEQDESPPNILSEEQIDVYEPVGETESDETENTEGGPLDDKQEKTEEASENEKDAEAVNKRNETDDENNDIDITDTEKDNDKITENKEADAETGNESEDVTVEKDEDAVSEVKADMSGKETETEDILKTEATVEAEGKPENIVIETKKNIDSAIVTGWVNRDDGRYYINKDGSVKTSSWINDNGGKYYVGSDGKMVTGWQTINSRKYYFTDSSCSDYSESNLGKLATGFKKIGRNEYYFVDSRYDAYTSSKTGIMLKGFKAIDGKRYYFIDSYYDGYSPEKEGIMLSGFKSIKNNTYYMIDERAKSFNAGNKNTIASGWEEIEGKKYYFIQEKNGAMAKGFVTVDGRLYYFNTSGIMQTSGKVQSGTIIYRINSDGTLTKTGTAVVKNGWKKENNATFYYVNGKCVTGVKKIGEYIYLFDADGKLMRGKWRTINGKRFCSDEEGRVYTTVKRIDGKVYYFSENGVMRTGWRIVNNKVYYFGKDGARLSGWRNIDGKTYYLKPQRASGLTTINGNLYFFDIDGTQFKDTILVLDKKLYNIDKKGIVTPHTHEWKAATKILHHYPVIHIETVQVGTKTVIDVPEWYENIYEWVLECNECGKRYSATEDMINHTSNVHNGGSWSNIPIQVDTVYHPAVTHEEPVYEEEVIEDKPEWDEEIIDYYYCECGEIKNP